MVWQAILGAGAALLGARMSSRAASSAADTQAAASDRAAELERQTAREQLDLQRRMYEEGVVRQMPFYFAGTNALSRMQGGEYALPPAFTGKVDLGQDPGYAFRLAEGQKALERSAAARGGLLSGAAGKALTRYGQEMGSQEYQNAYNRALDAYNAQVQRSTTGYNRLSSLAGVGQTTSEQLGAAGRGYANAAGNILGGAATNIGNLDLGAAQAQGQAALARGSAYGTAINQLAYLGGRYFGGGGGGGGVPAVGGGGGYMPGYDPYLDR